MGMLEEIHKIPKYLKGTIPRKTRQYLLVDDYINKITHSVRVFRDFVGIRPIPDKHMLIIGKPDESIEPDKNYETSIYVCDHAHILIRGEKKGNLEILIKSDEYPTTLSIDKTERRFYSKEVSKGDEVE